MTYIRLFIQHVLGGHYFYLVFVWSIYGVPGAVLGVGTALNKTKVLVFT